MKKRLKHIVLVVLVAVIAILALPFLVYVPPVQNWLVQRVADIASEETGMDISVDHVDLSFPLDLGIDGLTVVRQGDTIVCAGHAVADVDLWALLNGEVAVDGLKLENAQVNTLDLISDLQIKGSLGLLNTDASLFTLHSSSFTLHSSLISDADITVLLSDTAAVDTTESEAALRHVALNQLCIQRSSVSIHLPGDSMLIGVGAEQMTATDADIDLVDGRYTIGRFTWQDGTFLFDQPFEPRQAPDLLDYSHIDVSDIDWQIDSLLYQQSSPELPMLIKMKVGHAAMKDVSGLHITELQGPVRIDDKGVLLRGVLLRTPYSNIYTQADVDYSIAETTDPGRMNVTLRAQVGKQDVAFFYNGMDMSRLPDWPLELHGQMRGSMQHAAFDITRLQWPTLMAASGRGTMGNLTTPEMLQLDADVQLEAYNLSPLLATFDVAQDAFLIPSGLTAEGHVQADRQTYSGRLLVCDSTGTAHLNGFFNQRQTAYDAHVVIRELNLARFLPHQQRMMLDAEATLKGEDDNFTVEGIVNHLEYEGKNLDSIQLQASMENGHTLADVKSGNALIDGTLRLDATQQEDLLKATVSTALNHIDLYTLGITEEPLMVGLTVDFDVSSNMKDTHRLSGLIDHISLRDTLRSYKPEKVGILMNLRPDTTYVRAQSGSLIVKLDASGGYEALADKLSVLADSAASQFSRRVIDHDGLKELLPNTRLYMSSGQGNPMSDFLKTAAHTKFKELLLNITTSPTEGINGEAHLLELNVDSTRIDSIFVTLKDKPNHGLTFQGRVANNRRNPQFVFKALVDGLFQEHGLSLGVRLYDGQDRMGLRLGSKVEMVDDGLRFYLMPSRPTIGYQEFALNDDNFLMLKKNTRIDAKVSLLADDGTGLRVYSEDCDSSLLQDLTVSLYRFDLGKLTAALPYVPHITGLMGGDYHLTMDEKRQVSVACDMMVQQLTYESCPMGNMSTEFVYLQREDDSHAVEGTMSQNGREIAAFNGSYHNKKVTGGHERVNGMLTLMRTPLNLINGFIPDQLMGLEGYAEGDVSVAGSLSKPIVNGEILLDSAYLVSQPYGIRLRFDNDPVRIEESKLLLENFTMYAYNDNPLNIMGNIDFHDLGNMTVDMRMRATDFQLINARQTAKSIAYGKGFVNVYAQMSGPMDRLRMRGKLDVLGNTDMTYLLLDSPLSTDNQLEELVKFTDFTDTTQTVVQRPAPNGLDMDLRISIDQNAHVMCGLNADLSNYIDLYGGGDLRMLYNQMNELLLTGRYTLTNGQMKYSLPVIPLKTFSIRDGSYVEFTGDPMNPTLHITATESKKASVGQDGEKTRSVSFNCGVLITGTREVMGVQFIVEAPEDYAVNSELIAMSAEQRGKLAVTMLTTGMYLADGNTSGFSMNSALSSFLESEINNITGNALKDIDLSVGLDNATDASGRMHTDYSFKFAKRFWNNRLKVQIGGKVSTGNEVESGKNQSFFGSVSMEYRLSPTSNQYVKLFFDQNSYDWLEGYTSKYGGGYIWKKKLGTLGELKKSIKP